MSEAQKFIAGAKLVAVCGQLFFTSRIPIQRVKKCSRWGCQKLATYDNADGCEACDEHRTERDHPLDSQLPHAGLVREFYALLEEVNRL